MATDDFFRARLDGMVDPRHPLAVLARRMPWSQIEASLAPLFARKARIGKSREDADLFGPTLVVAAGGVSRAGRPRLPIRLMVSLLYLKHAFNESDESVVERWSENVVWQLFSGMEYYQSKLPCDATQLGRFRRVLGEAGVEQLLKTTIEAAVAMKAVKPVELERVTVDTTVQEKAIAHPTDSRLLEVARAKIARLAKRAGLKLKMTHEREGQTLRRRAGGYAHAKQFKRLRQVVRRQRTILGVLLREVQRKMTTLAQAAQDQLKPWLERAERIRSQRPHDKNKLYALHAPEVECVSKGKARKPYEFGVKPMTAIVDLGYRGVDADIAPVELIHRGKYKSLNAQQRRWLKRRQAIEPTIGHTKHDHRMDKCWLKGSEGDALHAVLCAAGFNIRWLLRALRRQLLSGDLKHVYSALIAVWAAWLAAAMAGFSGVLGANAAQSRQPLLRPS